MKKRIVSIILAIATLTSLAFGCKAPSDDPNAEFANRPINVKFGFYYAGYGDAHWYAMARDFMENYDEDIYWEMVDHDDSANMRQHVLAGTDGVDIIQLSVDMFRRTQYIEELSEVYNSAPLGETTLIKDKGVEYYNYHKEKYKDANGEEKEGYFQLPASRNGGYNFAYNKTTLDEIFGVDGYKLPVTTDEFFKFGNDVQENGGEDGAYLTSIAMADKGGGDYFEYIYQAWFAQLMGKEKYDMFYEGYYADGVDENANVKYTFNDIYYEGNTAKTDLKIHKVYENEIKDAYNVIRTLFTKSNKYIHPSSPDLDYLGNDKVFAGAGDGLNFEKTAFLAIGSYLETELAPLIEDGVVEDNEYGMMRVPVASALVKQLEFIDETNVDGTYPGKMKDQTLAAIIRAIDEGATYENIKTKVSGIDSLTVKDFNRIVEARKISVSNICSNIVVPKIEAKDEGKREAIYKILRYLASDRAQEVCTNALGGLGMLAFGKMPTGDKVTVTPTKFIKDCNDIADDSVTIDWAHKNKIFREHVTVKWYISEVTGRLGSVIYESENPQTADKMFESLLANQSGTWATNVEAYKKAMGINN